MEKDIFFSEPPSHPGTLLLSSQWRPESECQTYPVFVYQHCILSNQSCIALTYSLRFGINERTLTFYNQDERLSFEILES